ncbi:hypothetical protein GCK72_016190 [Caenorhabditis remanei]|uniref:Uncharacterized protein n=1 Tax=Caenorhabditis remanei TaxID=31234 RepID=A0A6A5GZ96_CAERE|nr:hypothetical protein GCK72_016190 [Caenorhabditis remanei]KAF1759723.1 hypothetical protein GCK72_016190 [Caenorhabditis remanei]
MHPRHAGAPYRFPFTRSPHTAHPSSNCVDDVPGGESSGEEEVPMPPYVIRPPDDIIGAIGEAENQCDSEVGGI